MNLGSQRMELAVVSWAAMVKGEDAGKVDARVGDGRAFGGFGGSAVVGDLRDQREAAPAKEATDLLKRRDRRRGGGEGTGRCVDVDSTSEG